MNWVRLLIFGVPLAAAGLTWWSALQARTSRISREGEVTALLPGAPPALNPFTPATEVDRQLVDLIHEPLIRIGPDGNLKPALAERWEWSQTITIWFLTPEVTAKAAAHLKSINADKWIEWNLESVNIEGNGLVLHFAKMAASGPQFVLEEVGRFEPLPAEIIRIELNEAARPYHEHFLAHAVEAAQIKRVWYEGSRTMELVVSGNVSKFYEEITNYYQSKGSIQPRIVRKDKIFGLREPALEMVIKEGVKWHDGTDLTAEDVRATHAYVMSQPWPMTNREALSQVQTIDTLGNSRLRILYRKHFGPAICGWVNLPILPASWLKAHPADPEGLVFTRSAPPGAGIFLITHRDLSSLALAPTASAWADFHIRRLTFISGASAFQTRLGFATGAADLFWPDRDQISDLQKHEDLEIRGMPPRSRLLVLWNTRSPMLSDVGTRAGLALATDRQALIDTLLSGRGRIHEGLFQPGLWFAKKTEPAKQDLDAAARELGTAGWLKDVSGQAKRPGQILKFELLTTAGSPQRQKLAEALASQWRKVGAEVTITALPWEEMIDSRLTQRKFDAAIIGLEFETTWDQLPFWHSSQAGPGGLNFSGVADRQIDVLLETLREEFDSEQVAAKAGELDDRLRAKQAMLPLFTDMAQVAVRESVLQKADDAGDAKPWTLRDLVFIRPSEAKPKIDLKMIMPEVPALPTVPQLREPPKP